MPARCNTFGKTRSGEASVAYSATLPLNSRDFGILESAAIAGTLQSISDGVLLKCGPDRIVSAVKRFFNCAADREFPLRGIYFLQARTCDCEHKSATQA